MGSKMALEVYKFDLLQGTSKDGKTKEWSISVERYDTYSEIVTVHGYKGMSKVETRRRIDKGKNLNKSNATTPFTQAKLEAQSKWTKKHDIEKYMVASKDQGGEKDTVDETVPSNSPKSKKKTSSVGGPHLPMLAQDFNKHKSKVVYPCFVQPKLDGYRMIYDS